MRGVSKDGRKLLWFETRRGAALLTMRSHFEIRVRTRPLSRELFRMAMRDVKSILIDTEMNRFILKECPDADKKSEVNEGAYLYIVRCSDGSLYIGTTRTTLEIRIAQHNDGTFEGYTRSRRPVVLIFSQWFDRITDAIENERKLKKWTRAKKEAFIRGDIASLQMLARRRTPHPSRPAQRHAPQDEDPPSS